MNTQEVANRLVALCRQGQNMQAVEELYAPNVVSREVAGAPNELVEGFENVKAKSVQWYEMVETVHGGSVSDPVVAGNHFSCAMTMDITMKGQARSTIEEVCVYEVKDGKIVGEQFFYPAGPA